MAPLSTASIDGPFYGDPLLNRRRRASMAYIAAMTDFDPNVAGWHRTYEQPTGACYVITVGLSDIDAARALARW